MSNLVEIHRMPSVATVELNRPERHNSLIPDLLRELLDAIETVGRDEQVRGVVLAAAGRSFSTGGDVNAFFSAGDRLAEYAADTVGLLNEVILAMMRLEKPIVAAVHGMVTGGSLGLLLGSDMVLVAPEATITPWYSVVGYSPDGGWTALLPDIIGEERTERILVDNETVTANEAVSWGLAAAVVSPGEIRERAALMAAEMESANRPFDEDAVAAGLEAERRAFIEQILTPEAQIGMESFLKGAT